MIFINGRFATMPVTGVQRYAHELLNSLDDLLYRNNQKSKSDKPICLFPPDITNIPKWKFIQARKVGFLTGNVWEQIELPFYARDGILFSPANIGPFFHANQFVTIHDASVFAFPEAYSFSFKLKYKIIMKRLAKKASGIITDSYFSQSELSRYLNIPAKIIKVIPLGCEHLLRTCRNDSFFHHAEIGEMPYFLAVGSQSLHKNFAGLLKAFQMFKETNVELVVVGGKFDRVFKNSGEIDNERVRYLSEVNDTELCALYKNAICLVFPSFYEGFGFPVLEAMSLGCATLCSNASSLPEIGGKATLYFDPSNSNEIFQQMTRVMTDTELRNQMVAKGFNQAKLFSWETTAINTWEYLTLGD
jgi:glycosyltransferase involved in cell wall biosynthesis